MSPTFDPYYKWLAIPPAEQPPNHYRLLALNLFEADADVIATAADQRMAHVRSFQTGQYVDASQRLLNELATARICLLKADKKAAYDAGLRAMLAKQAARTTPPPPPPAPPPAESPIQAAPPLISAPDPGYAAAPVAPAPLPPMAYEAPPAAFVAQASRPDAVETIAAPTAFVRPATDPQADDDPLGFADSIDYYPNRSAAPRLRKRSFPWLFFIAPLAGVAAVIVAVTIRNAMDQTEGGEARGHTEKSIKRPIETSLHTGTAGSKSRLESAKPGRTPNLTPQFVPADDTPAPTAGTDSLQPTPATEKSEPQSSHAEKESSPARLPVPDAEAQRKALLEIKEVFKDEFTKANSIEGREKLAKKLGAAVTNPKEDPTIRYVSATQSLELAVKVCDAKLASDQVHGLTLYYDLDAWELKAKTLSQLASVAKTPELRKLIAGGAFDLVEKALTDERYDAAVQLAATASELAALLPDKAFRAKAIEAHARARRMQQEAAEVQTAQERLARHSDDAAAHLLIGRFFCLERNDWDSGLPHLVRGSDAELGAIANRELAGAPKPEDQLALADAWWELAEQRHDPLDAPWVKGMRNRAAYWYRRALPQLSGFAQAKAQKRISDASSAAGGK